MYLTTLFAKLEPDPVKGDPNRRRALTHVASALIAGLLASLFASALSTYLIQRSSMRVTPPLENQLVTTLEALRENSRQAVDLMARLQTEMDNRTSAVREMEAKLNELRQQRSLLELTPEQRRGIESLVQKQPSAREIFWSLDFWLGKVLVTAIFFGLGIAVTLWRVGKGPSLFSSAESVRLHERLDHIAGEISQLVAEKRLTPEDAARLRLGASAPSSFHPAYRGMVSEPILPPSRENRESLQDDQKQS